SQQVAVSRCDAGAVQSFDARNARSPRAVSRSRRVSRRPAALVSLRALAIAGRAPPAIAPVRRAELGVRHHDSGVRARTRAEARGATAHGHCRSANSRIAADETGGSRRVIIIHPRQTNESAERLVRRSLFTSGGMVVITTLCLAVALTGSAAPAPN